MSKNLFNNRPLIRNNRKTTSGRNVQIILFYNKETGKIECKKIIHAGNSAIKFK